MRTLTKGLSAANSHHQKIIREPLRHPLFMTLTRSPTSLTRFCTRTTRDSEARRKTHQRDPLETNGINTPKFSINSFPIYSLHLGTTELWLPFFLPPRNSCTTHFLKYYSNYYYYVTQTTKLNIDSLIFCPPPITQSTKSKSEAK